MSRHPDASDIGATRTREQAALDAALSALREVVDCPMCPQPSKQHAILALDRIAVILGKTQP